MREICRLTAFSSMSCRAKGLRRSLSRHILQRSLKAVPKEVRSSQYYQEAKEVVAQLRSQASRLRSGLLEGLITSGEPLEPNHIQQLMRLPAARDMFQRLIWQTQVGQTGLLDAQSFTLQD